VSTRFNIREQEFTACVKCRDTLYIGIAPISTKRRLTQKEKAQAKEISEKLLQSL
jgi:hypothetical protein